MRSRSALLLLALASCVVGYEPEPVRHRLPLPAHAFDAVVEAVELRFGRIELADRAAFRVQSRWCPFQRGDAPGFRRATVFCDEAGKLQVLVEAYYVRMGWSGPYHTEIEGDRIAEQQLAGAIEDRL